jgi:hypothetical protein
MLRPGIMLANSANCAGQAWFTVYFAGHFGWIQKLIPCPLRDWQMSSRNAFAEDEESIRKQRAIWINLRVDLIIGSLLNGQIWALTNR